MQIVKASRDALLKPLTTVSGIVERRHTLPILANLLLRKKGDKVSFLATDIEIQISTQADFGTGSDEISTTVAARKLLDILRALPESGEVTLSHANKKLTVQSGKSRFSLATLDAAEFPTVAQPDTWAAQLSMSQKTLKHLISMVYFSMAQQDIRYYLNGLLFVTDGKHVKAVATDGHRLAFCQVEIDGANLPKQEVIIPRKTVLELMRLLEDNDDAVAVAVAANQIKFSFNNIELISKLVEGKFPDYSRVIPSGYTKHMVIDRAVLQGALQRAAILTSDKFKSVRWTVADNTLKINSTNAEQEEANEELEVTWPSDGLEIGFNVTYLLDVLANLKTQNVQVSLNDANASALLTLPDSQEFKYVVMPMRI
jgi:DNA polymerase III subunit beta